MDNPWTDRERMLIGMFRETTVTLGCELIKRVGEREAAEVFAAMMQRRVDQLKEAGLLGSGFQALVDLVTKTASIFGQDISFDVDNRICRVRGCGLWEAGKKLGYGNTPLCIRCKANSDTVLAQVLPGYRKTMEKSLWWGDGECYMTYRKDV